MHLNLDCTWLWRGVTVGYMPGSNYTKCGTEVTCGFDTHYPEYFPVRTGFQAALATMQELGVRVAPYINGRIFDKGTKSWEADGGTAQVAAAKQLLKPALLPSSAPSGGGGGGGESGEPSESGGKGMPALSDYNESYGSLAKFAVMCPHTAFWQQTIAKVVDQLANDYGTDGIYIDQIAAAGPRPCWDPSHNHTLGGGDHWVTGYSEMLRQVREAAGSDKILLTESNSEPFMVRIVYCLHCATLHCTALHCTVYCLRSVCILMQQAVSLTEHREKLSALACAQLLLLLLLLLQLLA